MNDALKEKDNVKEQIKKIAANLNSTENTISTLRSKIEQDYAILRRLKVSDVAFDSWLDHNANLRMLKNISIKKMSCRNKIDRIEHHI
ncbi:hypothetical protein D3C84_1119970 [compost metagenome]